MHCAVALLGAMLLLRQDDRLLLAPLYGAGLLLSEELGSRSTELRDTRHIGPDVIRVRVTALLAVAALGACASVAAAVAVTVAPGRSLTLTAMGAIAIVATFAALAGLARRRQRAALGTGSAVAGAQRVGDAHGPGGS